MSTNRRFLIHPQLDLLLLGGLSLICSVVFLLLGTDPAIFAPYVLTMLLIFSYPHFLASSVVFYSHRAVFKEHPYIALWIPLGLIAFFIWIVANGSTLALMLCGQAAILLLFWHFLKQAYGVSLWLGNIPGRPLEKSKKTLLLAGCMFFGAYGYMGTQGSGGFERIFRTSVARFHVQPWAITLFEVLGYLTLGQFLIFSLWDYCKKRERADFHPRGIIPLLAMMTWFEPHLYGSPVIFLLPIFHALQYLPFPIRTEINAIAKRPAAVGTGPRIALYFVGLILIGALAFEGLPRASAFLFPSVQSFYFFGCVSIFLNLHHFFIDSVIWRFRDPVVLQRLAPLEVRAGT